MNMHLSKNAINYHCFLFLKELKSYLLQKWWKKALHFFKLTPANPAVEFQNERLENKVEKVLLRFCFAAMDAKGFL